MQVDGYGARHFEFGAISGGLLALATVARWLFNAQLPDRLAVKFFRTRRIFRALSIGYNLYWGCLTAAILLADDAPTLRWLMLISTVGLAAGGTASLAIDDVLARIFPIVLLGPLVCVSLYAGGAVSYVIAGLAGVFFAYSVTISRLVSDDYWARQQAQASLEQRAAELESLSRTDALTLIPNRLRFQERLPQVLRAAHQLGQSVAVAMVDLDHFKKINDTYGHPFGDRCLQMAAAALTESVHRPGDLVARYGGEEFVVLMPDTDLAGARVVAERMLARVRETVVVDGESVAGLSCSIGVSAQLPTAASQPEYLLKCADTALYEAKQNGRARVMCFDVKAGGAM